MPTKIKIVFDRVEYYRLKGAPLFRHPNFKRWKEDFDELLNRNARRNRRRVEKTKALVKEWKSYCFVCGKNGKEIALEAHHLIQKDKEFKVADILTVGRLKKELEKCIPVCRNCHEWIHKDAAFRRRLAEKYLSNKESSK